MDNFSYYNTKREQIPVARWDKKKMMQWPQEKNVRVDDSLPKTKLMNLVRKHKLAEDKYVVDELDKAENKIVLQIPPHHWELNPIELAWSIPKEYVKNKKTTFKLDKMKQLLFEGIESVTKEDWRNAEDYTISEEAKFREIDDIVNEFMVDVNSYLFYNDASDTSSDSSDVEM